MARFGTARCLPIVMAVFLAATPAVGAQTLDELREAMRASPRNPDAIARFLVAYGSSPSNRASRMERRGTERDLSARLLGLDPDHPVGLETAARWALDDYQWNAVSWSRFRTGYFERRRDEAFDRTEALLLRLVGATPWRREAHVRLAALYAYAEDWVALSEAAERFAADRPGDPTADLHRGLAHHMLFEDEAASAAFDRALAAMPPGQADTWRDVLLLVSPDDTAGVVEPADVFWFQHDPRRLTPFNERLSEHLARMVLADLFFGSDADPGWNTVEGELIVRYGLPTDPAATLAPYGRAGIDFLGSVKHWRTPDFDFVLEDPYRTGDFRYYSPPLDVGLPDYEIAANDYVRTRPESYGHQVAGQRVDVPWAVSVLRGSGNRADVIVAYGIPLEGEMPELPYVSIALESGVFLTGEAEVVTESRRSIRRLETSAMVKAGTDLVWADHHELSAGAGRYGLSVEFETADRAIVGFQRDSLIVPAYRPDSLSMSDIVLATLVDDAGGGGGLIRGGVSIRPAAWGVFEVTQPIYLYFEPYGLTPGADARSRYTVEAVLQPVDEASGIRRALRALFGRDPSDGVSVRFEASGVGPDDAQYLILDASGEELGAYAVGVRITDLISGRTVESTRPVWLVAAE